MTDNQLRDWTEIRKLGAMYPCLSSLVLANNHVTSVDDAGETFPNLRSINLNNSGLTRPSRCPEPSAVPLTSRPVFSALSKWEDIERLSFFPKLVEIKAQGIPLLQSYSAEQRHSLLLAQ